ncbi:MAG: GNAT family N-acetyltransferase [Bacteroidetes bacterium]|nr:GNAT family N-acetyltransferase [Bacteroidota bacterium]
MDIEIRMFFFNAPEYLHALALRDEVLRKPLGLKFTRDELEKDKPDIHFGLFADGEIVACLILSESGGGRMKMRQVAVSEAHQRIGLGMHLSNAAEKYAVENECHTMYCHARKEAVPFYLSMGYQLVSDEFLEIGLSHYIMEKGLS